MHTNIRRNPTNNQILNTPNIKHQLEIRVLERASAWLINDLLSVDRVEFGNDIVAYFSAHEETAQGSFVADSET
jgi:hypothetical protein